MKRWFSYDPGLDRMSFHETADQAKAAAQEYLDSNAEVAADEGWPDETPWICWGQLMGKADLVSSEPDSSGRFDTIDKYELSDLREPPEMDRQALLKAISLPREDEIKVGDDVVITNGEKIGSFGCVVGRAESSQINFCVLEIRLGDGTFIKKDPRQVMKTATKHVFTWCGENFEIDDKTAEQLKEMARKLKDEREGK